MKFPELLGRALIRLIVISLLGSLLALAPAKLWILEVNRSFGGYYLALHAVALLFLLTPWAPITRIRRFALLALLLLMSARYLRALAPFYREPLAVETAGCSGEVKVYYTNIFGRNERPHLILDQIGGEQPDIVLLTEMSEQLRDVLKLEQRYEHAVVIPRHDNFGLAMYSRFPIMGTPLVSVGDEYPPVILAELALPDGRSVNAGVFHAIPPFSQFALETNRIMVRRFAGAIRERGGHAIIAGDLNATPFSSTMAPFIEGAALKHVWWGRGLPRTWDAGNPLLRLTLDHMFIDEGLRVRAARRLDEVGSDHFPLAAEFTLCTVAKRND